MRIQQISVSGLFGIFDHVIPLNMDERITIIHGPNGFGKTVMLRMLNGFFNSQYSVFQTIPFRNFRVEFDNRSSVEIVKTSDPSAKTNKINDITCNFYDPNSGKASFILKNSSARTDVLSQELFLWIAKSLSERRQNQLEGIESSELKSRDEPEWLENVKNNIHVRLIESQRLLNSDSNRNSRLDSEASSMLPTVSAYADELAQLIQVKLAEYGTTAQSLDRTFPARVVKQQPSPDLTDEQLRHQLNELEETRSRLIEVGLLDKDENSDFQIQSQAIDESTKNILSVYVEDVEKKLSVFDEIASKIELLRRIINNKFAYSYKEMNFNKEKGFVFKTLYSSSSSNLENLSPIDLSSGEQHELVLLYELLFKVQPGSLVLIDEPELSLHVGWQVQFLKDLQEITKLADLDILMATHSPDIIQDRWDLTVELKGPGK
ncbi:MAG TPA: excinuclease [Cyanobacteria bacterium UBA11369]|nr:excinuclease [Cyanobacteria bacterium UBA11371]HBE16044.1 excinuclease [Cyanobacteria bacterium UBA11367]HBE49089.1 excinuclease [Cyanobacteria bacterium UBA11369]